MISPYVRRLRLAQELRELRTRADLTHEQLAKKIGQSRAQISRLENGHVVDQADILKILDALEVDDQRWTDVLTIAREAGERGWWESLKGMGERQAFYANLEAGAVTIREFQMVYLPGLLQTDEFTRVRAEADSRLGTVDYSPEKVSEARATRQRMLRRPGGPTYHVILDEVAVRRVSAPPEVLKAQLYHISAMVNGTRDATTLQILPIDAAIEGYSLPRSAFSVYTFEDPRDPTIVAVDTITEDLTLTKDDEVKSYEELFGRLADAALSPADSLDLLLDVAKSTAAAARADTSS